MLQNLSRQLIPKSLREKEKDFLIIPDKELHYLNFELLIDEDGNHLIQNHKVRYAYSLSLLNIQNQLGSNPAYQYDVISYVPGFDEELRNSYLGMQDSMVIDSTYFSYVRQPFMIDLVEGLKSFELKKFIRNEATELNFKSNRDACAILHFGTHGVIDDDSPMFSKLIMAKDQDNDGYLHAYEIFNKNLDADLAVLCACNTGQGKIDDGEGVMSLAHAFSYAGVPSTVMTLWEVDEKSTAQILEKFYFYLNDGSSKSEALRQAKLDFLSSAKGDLRSPYYWAGLVVIGNDLPLVGDSKELIWWLFGLALLILFYLLYRKQRTQGKAPVS